MSTRRLTPPRFFFFVFFFFLLLKTVFTNPQICLDAEIALDTRWLPSRLFSLFSRMSRKIPGVTWTRRNYLLGVIEPFLFCFTSIPSSPPDALVKRWFFNSHFVFSISSWDAFWFVSRLFIRSWKIVKDKRRHWSAIISRSRLDGGDLWPAHKSLFSHPISLTLSLWAADERNKKKNKQNKPKRNKK